MKKYDYLYNLKKVFRDSFFFFKHFIEEDCLKLHSLLFGVQNNDLNKLCCGDADNFAWYIPHQYLKIFCFSTQLNNFIVFIKEEKKEQLICIYEYFNDFNFEDYDYENVTETSVPIKYFLTSQKSFHSDCIEGNNNISFPNLDFILKNNYFIHDKGNKSLFYEPLLSFKNKWTFLLPEEEPFLLEKFFKIEEFVMTIEFLIECISLNAKKEGRYNGIKKR